MNQEYVMQSTKPSDNEIALTRTFTASRATVFAALTQVEHLVNWLNPTDMTLVTCEVDLRVGGTFRYVFQRPSGSKIEVRGSYDAIDPPHRFVYTETYDFSPLKVLVTTDLDVADDKTIFKQTLRYSSKQERDEDFDGVATSATVTYAKLERYLAQIGDELFGHDLLQCRPHFRELLPDTGHAVEAGTGAEIAYAICTTVPASTDR
jgi:uncharacterized protein YndB with AHSA1/START domain